MVSVVDIERSFFACTIAFVEFQPAGLVVDTLAYSSDGVNPELGVPTAWENFPWMKVNEAVEIDVDTGDQKNLKQCCQCLLEVFKCEGDSNDLIHDPFPKATMKGHLLMERKKKQHWFGTANW
ncbi:unnamed protein product [Caretta caretta]